jgi:hypothetical protein
VQAAASYGWQASFKNFDEAAGGAYEIRLFASKR